MKGTRARTVAFAALALVVAALFAYAYRRYVWSAPNDSFTWVRGGTTYVLRSPKLLGVLLTAPIFVFMLGRSLADLPWIQRILSLLVRTAFVLLLALSLARVSRTEDTDKLCTVVLVDVSDSVPQAAIADAQDWVEKALAAKRPDDLVKVITFARRPRLLDLGVGKPVRFARHGPAGSPPGAASGASAQAVPNGVASSEPEPAASSQAAGAPPADRHRGAGAGTDVQAALQLAYGLYPPGYLRRAVLLSDGVQTDGNLLAEADRARGFGVRLFAVPYRRPMPGEIAVRSLGAPDHLKVGEPFELHADIFASRAGRARARLFQGEVLNGLDGVKEIDLRPGANDIVFRSVVRIAGEVTYRLELDPLTEDRFAENNHAAVTLDAPGKPAVLYVEGEAGRGGPLATALERQGFEVDLRNPSSFPASLKELERFDFLILSDTPADQISQTSQELVESYLREIGGGFLFAGGPNGYGPGGWYHTPIERILPVQMDAERRKDMPSVAMALVIDRSGSMSGLPLEMAKQAARATVDTLAPDDLIEVIAFDSTPTRYVKMQPARNRSRIDGDVSRIQAGGGTEIFPALDAAYQDLSVTEARKKHVVLLTDGRASSNGIRDLVQAMAAEAITVTTVGLGGEVDDQLLSMIKDVGGGRYHKVPDPSSLPRIFTREAEMVAKSAVSVDYFPVRQVGPADFLKGIDLGTAPMLGGYTATKMKPSPAQEILVNPDHGDPLLARWHVGLGYALAWTSDIKARWAADWLRWPGFSQFWGQLVREHMRQKHRTELGMRTEVVGGEVHAEVDAFTPDDRFENGLESKLTILGPEPGGDRKVVPLTQTAPGRYEARFPLDRYGSFLLKAEHTRRTDDGRIVPVAVSYGHVSNPYPQEYASFEPDEAVMKRAAEATGGSLDPDVRKVLDPGGEKIVAHRDLWPRFVAAAIVLLLLDLLVRRVRMFDRKLTAAPGRRAAIGRG